MSFVKRSKPRASASRISSAYENDDDDDAASSSRLPSAADSLSRNGSRSSTPRRTGSKLEMDEEEDEVEAGSVVFRPKTRVARGAPSISAATINRPSLKQRSNVSVMDEDEEEPAGGAFEIRRSKGKEARRSATGLSSTSSSTPKRSTPLRPTSFHTQQPPEAPSAASSSTSSNLYTSKYLAELRSSTPTTNQSRAQSPTIPLGPGTRIDDPMATRTSHLTIDDDALARSKFPQAFQPQDGIPSESVIRAAKEKRAKLRASTFPAGGQDYLPLNTDPSSALNADDAMEIHSYDGPHPYSRLQREEDEFGDGEEEFAEYTGASERIPIGEKAEREWRDRQRREMAAAVLGGDDNDVGVGEMVEEMDSEEEAWERAQVSRTQTTSPVQPRSREVTPYKSAPIPDPSPLPSIGICSTRLELTLRALEQSTTANQAVVTLTMAELSKLDQAERENKADVEVIEDKKGWFAELDTFVASLGGLMEEKIDRLKEIEEEAMGLLVRRNRILGKKRERHFRERLEICLGFKPRLSFITVPGGGEEEEGEDDESMNEHTADGEAMNDALAIDSLNPANEQSLNIAQQNIRTRLQSLFSDLRAVEYLSPAATTTSQTPSSNSLPFLITHDPSAELHPRSVVARFEDFRKRYPEEYTQLWGGLSVGHIWEFYARLELILWDPFSPPPSPAIGEVVFRKGAGAVQTMEWFIGASEYQKRAGDQSLWMGGDDEVLSSLIANVLVERLIALGNKGGYSVWSESQTRELVGVVDFVQTVLGADHARCTSLIETYLGLFKTQIHKLQDALSTITTPLVYITYDDEEVKRGAEEVAFELVDVLLKNLVNFGGKVDNNNLTDGVGQRYVRLVEEYVLDVLLPMVNTVLIKAEVTREEVRRRIVCEILPKDVVARSEKLSLLSQQRF